MKIKEVITELEKVVDKEQELAVFCAADSCVVSIVNVEIQKDENDKDVFCVVEEF